MTKKRTEVDDERLGTVVVRCQFTRKQIRRINRAAKLRGIDRNTMLRSWLDLIAEDELSAVEEEHTVQPGKSKSEYDAALGE